MSIRLPRSSGDTAGRQPDNGGPAERGPSPLTTEAFVYDALRTPRGRGRKTGSLHGIKPVSLVVGLIDEMRRRNPTLDPELIEDVVLGVVSPVGDRGCAVGKTAALGAGL